MLVDHIEEWPHGTSRSIYGRPTLRLHPISPVQSDAIPATDDQACINLGPLREPSIGSADQFSTTLYTALQYKT